MHIYSNLNWMHKPWGIQICMKRKKFSCILIIGGRKKNKLLYLQSLMVHLFIDVLIFYEKKNITFHGRKKIFLFLDGLSFEILFLHLAMFVKKVLFGPMIQANMMMLSFWYWAWFYARQMIHTCIELFQRRRIDNKSILIK